MIAICTQKEMQDRMSTGFAPMAADTFNSALVAASLRMETELETLFDEGTSSDVFYLDDSQFGVAPNGFFKLKLKNGFLRADAVTINIGPTVDDISEPIDGCQVDKLLGHVSVPKAFKGYYVKVDYSYGFRVGDVIPTKLKEAVLGYIPVVLDFSALSGEKKKVNEATEAAASHALAVLAPLRRRKPFLLSPIY